MSDCISFSLCPWEHRGAPRRLIGRRTGEVTKLTAALPLQIMGREEIEAPDADRRLVERFLRGDVHAFEVLFRKHQSYAFNVAYGLVGNSEDAADITQEAFLRVHRNMDRF